MIRSISDHCRGFAGMSRAFLALPPLLLLPVSTAQAHSFAVYISTPVTPPSGYEWVQTASLGLITITLLICNSLLAKRSLLDSSISSAGTTFAFWILFVFIGKIAATASTMPPPGLGPPSRIYWNWPGQNHWSLFVVWNVLGVVSLVSTSFFLGRLWKLNVPARLALTIAPILAYSVLLLPFVSAKAITHGWAGGYVMNAGEDQLYDLNRACFQYAEQHDGRFPAAGNIVELLPKIAEYLEHGESKYGNPISIHPADWAFEKEPRSFTWDSSQSAQIVPKLPDSAGVPLPIQGPDTGHAILLLHDLTKSR